MYSRHTLSVFMLAAGLVTVSVFATNVRAADASCKPVLDAMTKASNTPYHEFANAGGKSFEKIYTTTSLSVGHDGHWAEMPASPKDLMDGVTFTQCKSLRTDMIEGQPATVYAVRERITDTDADTQSQLWIGNVSGLPLKSESDTQRGGKTMHVSTRFTYTNVQAPTGAH